MGYRIRYGHNMRGVAASYIGGQMTLKYQRYYATD